MSVEAKNPAGETAVGTWGSHLNRSSCSTPGQTKTVQQHTQGAILHHYSQKLQHGTRTISSKVSSI